jgi:hypothetical protein
MNAKPDEYDWMAGKKYGTVEEARAYFRVYGIKAEDRPPEPRRDARPRDLTEASSAPACGMTAMAIARMAWWATCSCWSAPNLIFSTC